MALSFLVTQRQTDNAALVVLSVEARQNIGDKSIAARKAKKKSPSLKPSVERFVLKPSVQLKTNQRSENKEK